MKQIKCDFFGEGEYIYFNIRRLSQLEAQTKKSILDLIGGQITIGDIVAMYYIGVSYPGPQRRTVEFYEDALQRYLDNGGDMLSIANLALKAVVGSGIAGKEAYFKAFPEELTENDREEMQAEAEVAAKNG